MARKKKHLLPTSAPVMKAMPAFSIHMDEEKKRHLSHVCAEIMRTISALGATPVEAHAALTICRQMLGEMCGISDTVLLENPTEKIQ